jgi:hypothetical protein
MNAPERGLLSPARGREAGSETPLPARGSEALLPYPARGARTEALLPSPACGRGAGGEGLAPPAERVAAVDWRRIEETLDADGCARIERLLEPAECDALASLYPQDPEVGGVFRSRVVMARHGFGRGEYKYFGYPLPPLIASLREVLYPRLAPTANRWSGLLASRMRFPPAHDAFLRRCHAHGQGRPTPLLLRYGPGDFNCLHQDLYGEEVFPLQVVLLLSQPGRDFEGGEFVMTEQRPRMQSRPIVLPLRQGDAAVIAVNDRPVQGARGAYRVKLRHGVSRVRSGERFAAGIIFHDAT